MKREYCVSVSALAIGLAAGLWAGAANAATATDSAAAPATTVNEVVVTGSLIQGTPENAALPVTVLNAENLQRQGSPNIVELTKMLPESAGVVGDSNQFAAAGRGQGQYGTSTINLRGLGPERTLTLLNGHRLPLAFGFAVDNKMIPMSAVGRVEVLKDGAAATYGSDAIGGVVNFITKRNYNGFEIGGDARWVRGSAGDYTANATWGHTFGDWSVMVSAGFQHRSELDIMDRDWAIRRYDADPEGGWTGGGNPEAFTPAFLIPGGTLGTGAFVGAPAQNSAARLDLGCTALGGQLTTANALASPLLGFNSCRGQYTRWDALVEEENAVQVFGQIETQFGSHKLHVDVGYSYTNLPFFKSSPSYVTTRPVSSTVLPANYNAALMVAGTVPKHSFLYFVPVENPGFQAYMNANPGQFPTCATAAAPCTAPLAGAFLTVGTFRPYLTGGNPLYDYKHGVGGNYWHQQVLIDAELKGDITSAVHYDASFSWGQYKWYGEGRDSVTDRLELALRGLGGPGCNFQTGIPGQGGCMWYNPFSNAIPGAPRNGLTNPGYNSNVDNSSKVLADWLMPLQWGRGVYEDIDADFTLSGQLPFMELSGGQIGWAAGVQWRRNHYATQYDPLSNAKLSPCTDAGLPGGGANCPANANPTAGVYVFGPDSNPQNLSQNIFAAYGELTVPLTDKLNFDFAARYEDYGSHGGSTFNPQARAKWQLTDFFALRGSIGSTFRAPPQTFLIPDPAVGLQQVLGTFIPVASIGNPALKPETALTWSIGGIVEAHNFHFTIDYWDYNFKKLLTTEPLGSVVNAVFPTGGGDNCATVSPAFISSHFIFSGACSRTGVVAVNLLRINGPNIKTDGLDFNLTYRRDDVGGGAATFGILGTWVREYNVAAFSIGGVPIPGFNAAGFFNTGTVAYPIPRLRGQAFINYEHGPFNIRWTARYTSGYTDQRTALFNFNPIYVTPTNPSGIVSAGSRIKSIVLHDIVIRWELPRETVLTFTLNNAFDKDPSFARTDLNYDALTGDPLGRTVKVGIQKKF